MTRTAPGTGRTVALTFDDNDVTYLPAILQVLRRNNVRATFFDTGRQDSRMASLVAAMAAEGHLVEPHTWEHRAPDASNGYWSVPYVERQIRSTADQQLQFTGKKPCFFRPPYGRMNNVLVAARNVGVRAVLWSVDTRDWEQPPRWSTASIATIIKNGTDLRFADRSHPVVLLHGGKASPEPESVVTSYRGNTVGALQGIIDWYSARGYRFVAMDGTSGLYAAPSSIGFGSDARPDLLAFSSTGRPLLYQGNGAGYVSAAVPLAVDWSGLVDPFATDFSGDRRRDVLARNSGGQLLLFHGDGRGGFVGSPRLLGNGWAQFTALCGPGDVTGDGSTDVVARRPDGQLYLYAGNGRGGFAAEGRPVTGEFGGFDRVSAAGDLSGDGHADLLASTPSGELSVLVGDGRGGFPSVRATSVHVTEHERWFAAGDLTGDRRVDLVGLTSDGTFVLRPGRISGGFGDPVLKGRGWTMKSVIAVV